MNKDSLYRVSIKCFIQDEQKRVLLVREAGRGSWDLPGGGIDHGESIHDTIKRELKEEVAFDGNFTYDILTIDEPVKLLTKDIWQMRVVVRVRPATMSFGVGKEADDITFIEPSALMGSEHKLECKIYEYAQMSDQAD